VHINRARTAAARLHEGIEKTASVLANEIAWQFSVRRVNTFFSSQIVYLVALTSRRVSRIYRRTKRVNLLVRALNDTFARIDGWNRIENGLIKRSSRFNDD